MKWPQSGRIPAYRAVFDPGTSLGAVRGGGYPESQVMGRRGGPLAVRVPGPVTVTVTVGGTRARGNLGGVPIGTIIPVEQYGIILE